MTLRSARLPPRAALLLILAVLAGCKRDDARIPTAVEATAPVATDTPATLADATDPLGARDEVGRVMDAFLTVKSYHVDMTTSTPKGEMAMDMDFVAPDRYRMTTPMGTQTVIGDTMYMTVDGRTMKMALPKGQLANYRDPAQLEANKATMTVEALGNEPVDGEIARKFRIRNTQPQPSESLMWVGADGYPLKLEVDGQEADQGERVSIRYSRFNDPTIRIDPP